MIYESSKDYGTGIILLLFEGEEPTLKEIDAYTQQNYGMTGWASIELPSEFKGMKNPGTITVSPMKP